MTIISNAIVSGLNRYISADPERANDLAQINGKTIKIHLNEIDQNIILEINDLSVSEVQEPVENADVEINISLKVLPDFVLGVDKDEMLKNGDLEIKGDAHIASVFQHTMKSIEIDWEEVLSDYTGDAIAHQLGVGLRELHSLRKRMKENFRLDVRDYLQDNIQVAATKEEVDEFIRDVDTIRAQVERLEARINRLHSNNNT